MHYQIWLTRTVVLLLILFLLKQLKRIRNLSSDDKQTAPIDSESDDFSILCEDENSIDAENGDLSILYKSENSIKHTKKIDTMAYAIMCNADFKKQEYRRMQEELSTETDNGFDVHTKQNNTMPNNGLIEKDYDHLSGFEFENFCAEILKQNSFVNVSVTSKSRDHGIDILAEKDGITYAIQCKHYSSDVGNDAVQQAHAGKNIYKKDIAVVLTNQYFTQQAKEDAAILHVKLWNQDKLNNLIANGKDKTS